MRSSSGYYPPLKAQMRFNNLHERTDLSPSGITSNFSERDSPPNVNNLQGMEYQPLQHQDQRYSNRPSQITSKSRITSHTKYPNNESYD